MANEINFNEHNNIYITNKSSQDIYVLAGPNSDWLGIDAAFILGQWIAFPPDIPSSIKNIWELYKAFKFLHGVYSRVSKSVTYAASEDGTKIAQSREKVSKLLEEKFTCIKPGEKKLVHSKEMFDSIFKLWNTALIDDLPKPIYTSVGAPVMPIKSPFGKALLNLFQNPKVVFDGVKSALGFTSPSRVAGVLNIAKECVLLIATKEPFQAVGFEAHSDHSWIVTATDIVRASKENNDPQPLVGRHILCPTMGTLLSPGEQLLPGQALELIWRSNVRHILLHQTDGQIVLWRDNEKDVPEQALIKGTKGLPTRSLSLEADGNLVLWGSDGNAIWSHWPLGKVPESHKDCKLAFDDDTGNLGFYDKKGKFISWIWESGRVSRTHQIRGLRQLAQFRRRW